MDLSRLNVMTSLTDLRELRDLYKIDWPTHCIGYYTLQNYRNWLITSNSEKIENLSILTLDDDWHSDGLYLIVDRYQLFVNSLTLNEERLAQALKLIDWSKGYKITSTPEKYFAALVAHVKELNFNFRTAKLTVYHMPQATALKLQINCPAEFQLQPLDARDASLIDELWSSRHEGSQFFIKRLIELNVSMGLYSRSHQELVAWCTRCQAGFLGTLQTKEAYRRRGFAALVVKAYALQLANNGEDVISLVHEHNKASHQLFLKLGFKVLCIAYHMIAFRSPTGIEWPTDA